MSDPLDALRTGLADSTTKLRAANVALQAHLSRRPSVLPPAFGSFRASARILRTVPGRSLPSCVHCGGEVKMHGVVHGADWAHETCDARAKVPR